MRIFSWCQTWDYKKKKINSFCLYQYDNTIEETGVSLPTSVNERASDTTNKLASPSFIDKGLQSTGAQMTTYIIAPKCGNEEVNCHPTDGES